MRLGGRLAVLAVAVILPPPGWVASAHADSKPASHETRVRVRRAPDSGWETGTLVALTQDTLVLRRSKDWGRDTLALRDLEAVEVSTRMHTSPARSLGGLVAGVVVGGLIGGAIGSLAADDTHNSESWDISVPVGALIGGVFGGFAGLIVGQNPVPVWERLYVATAVDSLRSD